MQAGLARETRSLTSPLASAQVALLAGVLPTLPGMSAALGFSAAVDPLLAAFYDASWLFGTAVAGAVYVVLTSLAAVRPDASTTDQDPMDGTSCVPPWPA